jgi:hypothetical protein
MQDAPSANAHGDRALPGAAHAMMASAAATEATAALTSPATQPAKRALGVDDRDHEGTARNGTAQSVGDRQRRAAAEHPQCGLAVGGLDLGRCLMGHIDKAGFGQ